MDWDADGLREKKRRIVRSGERQLDSGVRTQSTPQTESAVVLKSSVLRVLLRSNTAEGPHEVASSEFRPRGPGELETQRGASSLFRRGRRFSSLGRDFLRNV